MKNRFFLSLLSLLIIGSLSACGVSQASNTDKEVTEVTQGEVASESTDIELTYDVLTVKTDWDSKAEVTFSDDNMTISGTGCTDENGVLYITEGGAYTLTGASTSASILINTDENVKLILNGVELTSTTGPVIYGQQVKNLYIELAEGTENTLTDTDNYETDSSTQEEIGKAVISCNDDIIILGSGALNVNGNHKHGIAGDDKLYIESGIINVVTTVKDGIKANDLLCIDGGTINITSENEGMESEDKLIINDGEITINSKEDGINASTYIEINGGKINVTSAGNDAIDSNGGFDGCITINGGEINATGADVPEGALDADTNSVIINGGKVTATGGCNSPIIENGGDNNITGETFKAGGSFGGKAGEDRQQAPGSRGDFNHDERPEAFDKENMPEPPEGGADKTLPQDDKEQ